MNKRIDTSFTEFAALSADVLKRAFWRKAPQIARRFSELGRPMSARTVRKMTERSDPVRRNPLDHAVLLLTATRRESRERFEIVWRYLEAVATMLRGAVRVCATPEAQFIEFRFAAARFEREWMAGHKREAEQALVYVDESVKGLFQKLQLVI